MRLKSMSTLMQGYDTETDDDDKTKFSLFRTYKSIGDVLTLFNTGKPISVVEHNNELKAVCRLMGQRVFVPFECLEVSEHRYGLAYFLWKVAENTDGAYVEYQEETICRYALMLPRLQFEKKFPYRGWLPCYGVIDDTWKSLNEQKVFVA